MDIWKFSLHWGWNPVIFFILLIASLVLALVVKKRVLWLVPALVTYAGLDWALPMSWLFKTVFWIGVIVVLVTAIFPGETKLAKLPVVWVASLVGFLLILGGANAGLNALNGDGEPVQDLTPSHSPSALPTATPTEEPTETAPPASETLNEDKLAKTFAKEFKKRGFKPGDVNVGKVNWRKNPVDHRGGAFGDGIKSQQELTEFLNSDTPEGQAARRHVLGAVPKSERERVLDGENYIPVQYNVDIQYGGNTVWENGKLVRGGKVVAEAGDIFWVFVGSDYKIYWDAAVRADCENPGLVSPPRPYQPPSSPPSGGCTHDCGPPPCVTNCSPPPTCQDTGTCPPPKCTPPLVGTPPHCLQPKDPSQDPAPQGNAPEGGGHNAPGAGTGPRNPHPHFPSTPHHNPDPPEPHHTHPTHTPTQPPEGGNDDGDQDNPGGDPGQP